MIGYLRGVLFIILYLFAGLLEGFFSHCFYTPSFRFIKCFKIIFYLKNIKLIFFKVLFYDFNKVIQELNK